MKFYNKHYLTLSLLVFLLIIIPAFIFANDTLINKSAPDFKVISGEKAELSLDSIKNKVTVLFYEAKNAVEQNRKLKNSLNIFYKELPDSLKKDIIRVGVVDCQGVLFKGIWEKALRDNSKKEGIDLYGDWDGSMRKTYSFSKYQSNIIIIDKRGIVRYYASGEIKDDGIFRIKELLKGFIK